MLRRPSVLRNPVDTRMLSGWDIWRRRRLNRRGEKVTARGGDALFGRRRRRTGPRRGGGCGRGGRVGGGFRGRFFFLCPTRRYSRPPHTTREAREKPRTTSPRKG